MRDPKEGISLAAVVAKETTQGSFTGTGGGIGLGTVGPGVFIGGMSGSKKDQTERDKSLAAPDKASFNSFRAYKPVFICLGAAVLSVFISYAISGIDDVLPTGLDSTPANIMENVSSQLDGFTNTFYTITRYILPLALLIAGILWFLLGSNKSLDQEEKIFKKQQAQDKIKESIYYRLRYVESDHIVFDPVTFREVPAVREHIIHMLNQLASEKYSEEKGTK